MQCRPLPGLFERLETEVHCQWLGGVSREVYVQVYSIGIPHPIFPLKTPLFEAFSRVFRESHSCRIHLYEMHDM